MADNLQLSEAVGPGDVLGTDLIGGVHYPRGKVCFGVDGAVTDASADLEISVSH